MDMQAWLLKRLLSTVSRICGRPYRPREPKVRDICKIAGVVWPEPEPRPVMDENPESSWELEEESQEEEEFSDDEMVSEGTPNYSFH